MKIHRILIWGGRISGLILSLFFLAFILSRGLPALRSGGGAEIMEFLPFAALSFLGYILAWFKPVAGGWILVVAAILTGAFFIYRADLSTSLVYSLPSLLVGFCFLAARDKELI